MGRTPLAVSIRADQFASQLSTKLCAPRKKRMSVPHIRLEQLILDITSRTEWYIDPDAVLPFGVESGAFPRDRARPS